MLEVEAILFLSSCNLLWLQGNCRKGYPDGFNFLYLL